MFSCLRRKTFTFKHKLFGFLVIAFSERNFCLFRQFFRLENEFGTTVLDPAGSLADALREIDGVYGAAADPTLLARLISDVLDMGRIRAGKMKLDVAETDLASAVDAAIETQRAAAGGRRVIIERTGDASDVWVLAIRRGSSRSFGIS